MIKITYQKLVLYAFSILATPLCIGQEIIENSQKELVSPNGDFRFLVYQRDLGEGKKQLHYSLTFKEKEIILESELGVLIENQLFESALSVPEDTTELWSQNLDLIGQSTDSRKATWTPVYGERSEIVDHYNELTLHFQKFGNQQGSLEEGHAGTSYDKRQQYEMDLIIRAYDEGLAFCYSFPESKNGLFLHIAGEQTSFTFPEETYAYYELWAQGPYERKPLKDWEGESERPLTLSLKNGLTVALTEARLVDFARTKFRLSDHKPATLETSLYNQVDVITPFRSPWRVIMAADSPGQLIENNDLILNLNTENKIEDTSWIKPGKVFRSGLTTEAVMEAVDFAVSRNLQYVHLDAGWYGPEMKVSSDASTVDPTIGLNLPQFISYGESKGIGLIVYVNQRALAQQLDEILPLYQEWGLKGIKFGFVHIGSDKWTSWMHEAIRKAADHQLMVNVHDEYRPTGFSRTYPNLMTQEGIRGNEEMPDADHNTILPFTRYLAGAADYTICYFSNRIKTSHAHQLALAAIYYSPLQYLYWYDKPEFYKGEAELAFFDKIKTVWDDTRVLHGQIGEYITVARRSEQEWFIGSITNTEPREITYDLDFLDQDKTYIAHIYIDDPSMDSRTQVRSLRYTVTAADQLSFDLEASGGAAVYISPATDSSEVKKLPKGHL